MRTVHFRSLAIAASAILSVAGNVAAQGRPAALLNSIEVRQLVARAEPADNARLSAHFSALADQYSAEANRHLSMAQGFVGNPSRNLGTGMSAHCKKLAELNTQSATTTRELAAYHAKLADGTSADLPRGAAAYHSGAGAPKPTGAELAALAARASSPADHRALEEYFLMLADRYAADAQEHAAIAASLRGTRIEQAAAIHTHLASLSQQEAKEATAAAEMHKQLANISR
jgi:hypothetical protein